VAITYTSGEQVEVYRFSIPATILIPLIAVFLQAWLSRRFPFFTIFDLPLLVVIGFATARRNPLAGLFTGDHGRHCHFRWRRSLPGPQERRDCLGLGRGLQRPTG